MTAARSRAPNARRPAPNLQPSEPGLPPARSDLPPPTSGLPLPASRRSPPASPLTEAQLSAIWRGQRFPAGALVTRAGVPVTVIFRGRPGRGPGPDFRGAAVAGPSGAVLRGDVELHVRASHFRAHGHHLDPAYAGLVLHVVFEDDDGADTALPGGGAAPVVALAPWVARRAGELQRWLERPLLWREPCHDAVMRMGVAGVEAALSAEGERRLAAKAASAAEAVRAGGLDQAAYEGLLAALGYGGNSGAMLALARLLPWADLAPAAENPGERGQALSEALLLGSAGLLPSQRRHRGPIEPHVERLESLYRASGGRRSLDPRLWKLWGIRPANAPARRLATAAALLRGLGRPSALLQPLCAPDSRGALAPLTGPRAGGYWADHHDPCAGAARLPPAALGRARALEVLVNVAVPVALASGEPALAAAAREALARLPRAGAYGVTRFLEQALAAEGVRPRLGALQAQGLLALHRDWCTQGGCGRCPLS